MVTSFIHLHPLKQLRIVFLFSSLFFSSQMNAQNLVPNPSFEIYDTCPDRLNQISRAIGWQSILNSPDYFCRCASGWSSLPFNGFGYQQPINIGDNCYAGIIPVAGINKTYHECIGISISSKLEIGKKYYFSFNYSAGYIDENIRHYNCFVNKLGMKMLTFVPNNSGQEQLLLNDSAFLYEEPIITDTLNWNLFSGSFIADSTYSFLLIGNFFNSSRISRNCFDTLNTLSYLYLDNICLSESENYCFIDQNNKFDCGFSIFPTVGEGLINLVHLCNDSERSFSLKLYNALGQLVYFKDEKGGLIELDIKSYARGIYFISIDQFVYKIILI